MKVSQMMSSVRCKRLRSCSPFAVKRYHSSDPAQFGSGLQTTCLISMSPRGCAGPYVHSHESGRKKRALRSHTSKSKVRLTLPNHVRYYVTTHLPPLGTQSDRGDRRYPQNMCLALRPYVRRTSESPSSQYGDMFATSNGATRPTLTLVLASPDCLIAFIEG